MSVEGMDLQDPLRLRLLSHLQCFSTQRLAAAKSSFQNTSWNSMSSHPSINSVNQYTGNSMSSMAAIMPAQHSNQSEHLSASTHNSISGHPSTSYSESRISQSDSSSLHNSMRIPLPSSMGSLGGHNQLSSMSSNSGQSITPPSLLPQQINTQFPMLNALNPMMSPNGSYNSGQLNQLGSLKPYRPWGSEIAYWYVWIHYWIIHYGYVQFSFVNTFHLCLNHWMCWFIILFILCHNEYYYASNIPLLKQCV